MIGRLAGTLAILSAAVSADAQHRHTTPADTTAHLTGGAMAIGVWSVAHPGPLHRTVNEAYLTQPMAFASGRGLGGRVVALGTLNAEGSTLARGEINPGVYGEGFVDRRHPHTWVHEAMVGVRVTARGARLTLFGGKGFVPYGTDDPMVRPFVKYPVNHHHAQVLERLMLTGSATWRTHTLEVATFNGDEPESVTDWPNSGRAFDSWSSRLTLRPRPSLEVAGSVARVKSPEFAAGFGLDQRKEAANVRYAAGGPWRYGLVEFARTREYLNGSAAFAFTTWLAEGTFEPSPRLSMSGRIERTTRPEEERDGSIFRTIRPHHDFNTLGRTRWTIVTLAASGASAGLGPVAGRPFVEAALHAPRALDHPAAIEPRTLYGSTRLWMLSAGVRLHAGRMRQRFGRYSE